MSACKSCGETYSLGDRVGRCFAVYTPIIRAMADINAHDSAVADGIATLTTALVRELTSAVELSRSELCGLCSVAAAPSACHACWAVALRGYPDDVLREPGSFTAELDARRAKLVAGGHVKAGDASGGWHGRKS